MNKNSLLLLSALSIVILLILHLFALSYALYWIFPWLDSIMHIIGGAWIVFTVGAWMHKQHGAISWSRFFLYSMIAILVIGSLWELGEFIIDHIFGTQLFNISLSEAFRDMMYNTIGGLLSWLLLYFIYSRT